jgi:uncharacterized protein YecT (DUF1311 family)
MKKAFLLISTLLSFVVAFSQTQYELNFAALDEFKKSDSELNAIYKTILNNNKEDTLFIKNLKSAQSLWIQFRDADMKMKYPEYPDDGVYGSSSPMCWNLYKAQLTMDRIKTLKEWITGVEEGDICKGSTPSKYEIEHRLHR